MKYFAVITALAATCLAQNIVINIPAANSTVSPGQWVTVEVDKPGAQSPSTEVALVLSMAPCPSVGCTDPSYNPSNQLGQILYNGPYNPQYHPETGVGKPQYQNFSIEVPTSFTSGENIALIATHINLIGAGPEPALQVLFVPLTVV
ncbi:uncharacterized protein PHACADRAFT_165414 [Phanerochaete carnosa HHB-10118-sp]|uniref:Glycoside hydrolase family 61 protein n=1 Tax=Phanerochaete carnosa (strain HHB-10118-sp) TaxID=650164 RepID=K5VZQ0_PHACS|nr:uncharacterized protein PHACADRAFT_165414 [Phanerochaete carnosa HHB-10118-sp]EKM52099.1 hypothetical protein PHACADRAFT_165414 [Phanerochaete carnosa HHB-10118-sp]